MRSIGRGSRAKANAKPAWYGSTPTGNARPAIMASDKYEAMIRSKKSAKLIKNLTKLSLSVVFIFVKGMVFPNIIMFSKVLQKKSD